MKKHDVLILCISGIVFFLLVGIYICNIFIDFYRDKTASQINYRDSVAMDSVVVNKKGNMDKQSAIELLCSQEQMYNEQIFEMKRQQVFENQIWQMLGSLNIVPFKDGNQWCCLYGKDLMSGIAGFGDTPYLAAVNLYEKLNKK